MTRRRELTADQREHKRKRDRERAASHREEYARLRDLSLEAHVRVGWDWESAYAAVYWVPVHVQRQRNAASVLRAEGWRGRSFEHLARQAWRQEARGRLHDELEAAVRGHMLSRRGQARGFDTRDLLLVNEATAKAMASEEVRTYWAFHGRPAFAAYRDGLLDGRGVSDSREQWVG